MSMDIMGTCPFCERDNVKLLKSHIIPKLVYKNSRISSKSNSRFRNILNFNQIFQNGETKNMLCLDCEQYFSKYETKISDVSVFNNIDRKIKKYIISVSWRILYDDIKMTNSNNYKNKIREYNKLLNNLKKDFIGISFRTVNKVFSIKSSILDFKYESDYDYVISGYSFYNYKVNSSFVICFYLGKVFISYNRNLKISKVKLSKIINEEIRNLYELINNTHLIKK